MPMLIIVSTDKPAVRAATMAAETSTAPGTPANCLAAPFNGGLLQVMRWPFFRDMTDHELRAIYEYLSAVPCNPGKVIADAPYLQNVCE